MRKKIILLAVCAVLLLFLASSSYGELNPKYIRLMEHPDQEPLISAPKGDQLDNVLLLIISYWNRFSLLIYIENDTHNESPNSQRLKAREVNLKPNNMRK